MILSNELELLIVTSKSLPWKRVINVVCRYVSTTHNPDRCAFKFAAFYSNRSFTPADLCAAVRVRVSRFSLVFPKVSTRYQNSFFPLSLLGKIIRYDPCSKQDVQGLVN